MSKAALKEKERHVQVLARGYSSQFPAIQLAWDDEQSPLNKAWQHFLGLIPKDPTRHGCLQSGLEYLRLHAGDLDACVAFLNNPPFLKLLLPLMTERAQRGDRIQLLFERFMPLPDVIPTVTKAKKRKRAAATTSNASVSDTSSTVAGESDDGDNKDDKDDDNDEEKGETESQKRRKTRGESGSGADGASRPLTLEEEKERQHEREKDRVDAIWEGVVAPEELDQFTFVCVKCGRKGTIVDRFKQTRKSDEGSTLAEKCEICKRKERT